MSCRADVLAHLVDLLDGAPTQERAECPNPAQYRVELVRHDVDSITRIWVELCAEHELAASGRDDYVRPVKLRD